MANYCNIIPTVRNKEGQEVDSILFRELLDYHNNDREAAKRDYFVATDQEFLDSIKENVTFDENGEITLHSLIKVAQLDPTGETIIKKLNRDIGSGVYDYTEGLQKAREFNRSEYGSDYLAILTKEGKKYRLSVVKNTSENQVAFEKVLEEQGIQTMIVDELNKVGVRVDFMEEGSPYNGKYSTENPTKAADGMYHLITLARGDSMADALKEEAAHFAIAALHDSSQVSRLIELCRDEEVVLAMGIFTQEEIDAGLHTNVYEAAGRILAKQFKGANVYRFGGFLNRVKGFIFSIVNKIKPESLLAKRMEVKLMAKQIANEFMSGKSNLDTALNVPMTLYSVDSTHTINNAIVTAKIAIKNLRNRLHTTSTELYKILMNNQKIQDILNANISPSDYEMDFNTAGYLLQEMAIVLIDEMENVYAGLQELYGSPDYNSGVYDEDVYAAVRSLASYADALSTIESALERVAKENPGLREFLDTYTGSTFLKGSGRLSESSTNFRLIIEAAEKCVLDECRKIGNELLIEIAGKDSIILKGKMSFVFFPKKDKKSKKKKKDDTYSEEEIIEDATENKKKHFGLYIGDEEIQTKDLINYIYYSDGWLGRLFRIPTKLKDTAVSYIRKWTKDINRNINRRVETDFQAKMNTIERLASELGYSSDMSDLIERDDKGKLMGNFISPCNTWKYEELRHKIIKEIVAECVEYIKDHKEEFKTKRSERVYINKQIEESDKLRIFEEESWIEDPKTGLRVLNPDYEDGVYVSSQYEEIRRAADEGDETAKKQLVLLKALTEYKSMVDSLLTDSSGRSLVRGNRIPQISTKKHLFDYSFKKALNGGLTESESDFELGIEGSSMYASALAEADESFAKLPIYGVKRIANPSSNIVKTLKDYTVMAVRYSELKSNVNRLYATKYALEHRVSIRKSQEDEDNVKAYQGILDTHLNRLFYGEDNPFSSRDEKLARKALGVVKNLTQSIFVMGTIWLSVKSMISNFFQSSTNYLRNAVISKHYSFWGYLRRLPRTVFFRLIGNTFLGRGRRRDKMILHHISGAYNRRVIWEDRNNPIIRNILVDKPMELYALGDAVGQEAVYLAMLDHYNGSEVSDTIAEIEKRYGSIDSILEDSDYDSIEYMINGKSKTKSLRSIYHFSKKDEEGNTQEGFYISNSFLRRKEDTVKYLFLKKFLDKINLAIEENSDPEKLGSGIYRNLVDLLSNNTFTDNLYKVFNEMGISLMDEYGNFISLTDAQTLIKEAIDGMLWKESDLFSVSDSLLSENVETQGTYYSDVKAHIQEDFMLKSMALYTGYMIGDANRNWNSGYDVLKEEYVPSKMRTVAFSWLNLMMPMYDANTLDRKKKSVVLWLSIAALNLPVLQQFTKIPRVQQVLKKGGYTDQMIKRMYEFGNDLLFWFFAYVILGMFAPRKPEEAAKQLGYSTGDFSKVSSKFNIMDFDIDQYLYDTMDRITGGCLKTHIIFDALNKPVINNDKIKESLSNYLTKSDYLLGVIQSIDDFEKDPAHSLELFSTFLSEYSDLLLEGLEPKEALSKAATNNGISSDVASHIELLIDYKDMAPVMKDGSTKVKMSYNEFLSYHNFEDNETSRMMYNSDSSKSENGEFDWTTVYSKDKRFNFTRAQDMELLSRHLLSQVYKGIGYDTESAAYKMTGIMYYFAKKNAEELQGMTSLIQNVEDIGTIGFRYNDAMMVLDGIMDIADLATHTDDPNFSNKVRSKFYNFFLNKVFLETDDYGYILPPTQEELDNMDSSEIEGRTGYQVQDAFKVADRRSNFMKMKGQ